MPGDHEDGVCWGLDSGIGLDERPHKVYLARSERDLSGPRKVSQAAFFVGGTGKRPVREWLMDLSPEDRKAIGEDIATLEFCWPIGKPRCSPIAGIKGLYEVRSNISSGRIARVFFVLVGSRMVLLHGFVKKTQKTPDRELNLATTRMKEVQRHEQ